MRNFTIGTDFRAYPVITGVMALATGAAVAAGMGFDLGVLAETPDLGRGELWRLLTSVLLHGDITHLTGNLYWLWEFGRHVERALGHRATALLILLFAVGSSSFDYALDFGGIGLSGVVYGLFGFLWVLWRRDPRFHDALNRMTILFAVAWFAFCIYTTVKNIFLVANVAHGAGFVFGVLAALTLREPQRRRAIEVTIGALTVVGLWGATIGRPIVNPSRAALGYEASMLGYEALTDERNEEAVVWLREATRFQPDAAYNWRNLGIALERLGDVAAAAVAYERERQLDSREAASSRPDTNAP